MLFCLLIPAVGISVVPVYLIDWLIFPPPPDLSQRELRFYNRKNLDRVGWEIPLVVFLLTYVSTVVYSYFGYPIEREVD